ncbi:MmcQ/YjbR family DNA-binding protein [Flavobacterium sp. J372]|uniref:MmcQ/YjbR family DNA-binding protein n=1 Tax=Flavobacterium sp. J372 TaxID=2898436 RepID=UPI002151A337|nr:MmcQ/YjbR family DNA-binding protein [Flavobacterium sp. J372]MCR5862349.1 MmcQ/YjbR family DNA-binding protein [Flavobacterium sp. J372]
MDINQIQQICNALPHVESEIKWKSDLVFMIARKMFCVIDLEALPTSIAFKVHADDYDESAPAKTSSLPPTSPKINGSRLLILKD